MSWIDPRLELPEDDAAGDPGPGCTRERLLGSHAYRFANVIEAYVFAEGGEIRQHGWTRASRFYGAPSFARLASEQFQPRRTTTAFADRVVFRQIVGARTVSPEGIGDAIGGVIGRLVAHGATGFPPIWTDLELTIRADGVWSGRVLRHSLFPSMTYVEQERTPSHITVEAPSPPTMMAPRPHRVVTPYLAMPGTVFIVPSAPGSDNAVVAPWPNPNPYPAMPRYQEWREHGWGPVSVHARMGPNPGNPWSLMGGVFDDLYDNFLTGN